ncbi:hypothetical protein [Streptomyces sp. NRRL F-5630]|uniref:hypothetical protein n=1 Tax=Streptomyces sp. NRRL F-5630 TaxID=1463864 RepID=UPI0004CC8652|nr:hypothetical protein [Streptomyces sp. NRRL F-5630]
MRTWNAPDHRIADTEHGTLVFEGDAELVLADWQVTEDAPDADGRVYASIRGWLANSGGSGRVRDPYTQPVADGRARLLHTNLRGLKNVTDRDVHLDYYGVTQPYPNTWDHPGYLTTVSWMDRRLDARGHEIPETEIGRTQWTHPETGRVFDLTKAYARADEGPYSTQDRCWQHYDRWSNGVPHLHYFRGARRTPTDVGWSLPLTDPGWIEITTA